MTAFCPFTKKQSEKSKFWKHKKTPRDIIILHMCTINDNCMMCVSWDMERGGQNFLSFWTIFCPFTPLKPRRIKILKKWKKRLEISSLYTNVPKIMIICYTVPVIRFMTDVILFFILGFFLPFYPPNDPKNQNFKNMKKNRLDTSPFYTCISKIMIIWCTVPEIWCATDRQTNRRTDGQTDWQTDRRTDGETEKVTYRCGCPPKISSAFDDVFLTWSSSKIWFFFSQKHWFLRNDK